MYDIEFVKTLIQKTGEISDSEMIRINDSLRINGIAVVSGFLSEDMCKALSQDATNSIQEGYDAGCALGAVIKMGNSEATAEFGHPFLMSIGAVELATNPFLLKTVEAYLEDKAIVHHALFQHSVPIREAAVDWHVDTGSNKVLNGASRFPDRRLRMIVYLTDVESGGLSYILDSRDAATHFLKLPQGSLYPQTDLSAKLHKKVTINEALGTIILFDAHGLHRPEPPNENRLVLNVWFARSDFSASLPPILFSLAKVPSAQINNIYVFGNERGASLGIMKSDKNVSSSLWRYFLNRIIDRIRIL